MVMEDEELGSREAETEDETIITSDFESASLIEVRVCAESVQCKIPPLS